MTWRRGILGKFFGGILLIEREDPSVQLGVAVGKGLAEYLKE